MDDRRFDDLTRCLARGVSRRAAIKGGAAALLGAVGLRGLAAAQVTQAFCGNVRCAANPGGCKPGCVCCVYGNGNSRCMPPGSCSGGTEVVPPTTPPPTTPPPTTPAPTTSAPATTTAAPATTTPSPTTPPPATTTTAAPTTAFPTTTTASPATTTAAPTTTTATPTTTTAPATTTTTTVTPTTTTTAPPDDGLACTDLVCDDDGCVHVLQANTCLIVGTCYAAGVPNPESACLFCNPGQNPRGWSRLPGGSPCGDGTCLTGATCTNGICGGGQAGGAGCAIDGVCYPAGATRPSNTCFVCDPARSQVQWQFQPNDTPCTGLCRTGATCQNGICGGGAVGGGFCEIDGVCVPAGEAHPTRGQCVVCDPASNPESWTTLANDTPCDDLCLANPTCQAGVCAGTATVVCEQPPDRELCQRAVCDPETGGCVMRPTLDLRGDTKGCEVCPVCVGGECRGGGPSPLDCGPCNACDEDTGTCVPKPAGGDCGSDCTTSRTCNAAGVCIASPGGCDLNIGCEAKVCNPQTQQCEETGANDGKPCGVDKCRVCQGGTCAPKCGPCSTCDPATGQCTTCEPCCGGICGQTSCGTGDRTFCCFAENACCTQTDGRQTCRAKDRVCEGVCYREPAECCGRTTFGSIRRCTGNSICCLPDLAFGCCDADSERCGAFGCVTRA